MEEPSVKMTLFSLLVGLASLCLAGSPALADDGDDTLRYYAKRSELILDATLTKLSEGVRYEIGVARYHATLKVHAVAKGAAPKGSKPLTVSIVRFELTARDRLAYLKTGARVVLFLKSAGGKSVPALETADVWFGVQPHSDWLVRRLTSMNVPKPKSRAPAWVTVSVSSASQPDAMGTVFKILEEHGIVSLGVSNAGGDCACVEPRHAKRARTLLRAALKRSEAKRAVKDAKGRTLAPPAAWAFAVVDGGS